MSERRDEPVRRLRALGPQDAAPETAATILPGNPRVGALDALLREVDGLRHTFETDLTLAAAAAEAGSPAIAVGILEGDRADLAAFEQRALGHLSELAVSDPLTPGTARRFRVPALPFVAAAALVGFLVGVVPSTVTPGPNEVNTSTVAATGSLEELRDLVATGTTSQVRAAATTMHAQLLAVVAQAGSNPEAAQQALLLLSYERDAIAQGGDSAALRDVLMQSTALTIKIRNALPASVRHIVPVAPVLPTPQPSASPKPAPTTAKATPSPSASPKPKPTASASPNPSQSPSQPGVLPSGSPPQP